MPESKTQNSELGDDILRLQTLAYSYSVLKCAEMDMAFMQEIIKLLTKRIEVNLKPFAGE